METYYEYLQNKLESAQNNCDCKYGHMNCAISEHDDSCTDEIYAILGALANETN